MQVNVGIRATHAEEFFEEALEEIRKAKLHRDRSGGAFLSVFQVTLEGRTNDAAQAPFTLCISNDDMEREDVDAKAVYGDVEE